MVGNSSAQLPLALLTHFFNSLSMTLLVALVCPLLCGWSTEVALCLIPRLSRNFSTPFSTNCVPLSEIKVLGIPNQHTMFFQMNFQTLVVEIVAMGSRPLSAWWSDQYPLEGISLVLLIGGKDRVWILPKWKRAMVLLCCVILCKSSGRRCQISGILHTSSHILCSLFLIVG